MNSIVVFGTGRESLRFILAWRDQIEIEYCLDNYVGEDEKTFEGYSVYLPTKENVTNKKIVITPAYYYGAIKKQLESYGLVENIDFWGIKNFLDYAQENHWISPRETKSVAFVGFNSNYDIYNNELINVVNTKYKVVLDYKNPQYIFCSDFGKPYEYLKYDGIRIYYSGENATPDFNHVDYGISYNRDFHYEDRFFRQLPFFGRKVGTNPLADMSEKTGFCNFIFGHDRDDDKRRIFFEQLSRYKQVDALGTFLNNMPDGSVVNRMNKISSTRKYKFSIAFESVDMSGFVTEKISDAFDAGTIPIFMGDPFVSEIFNKEAFIHVNDYPNFDAVIDKIIELDCDDRKYMEMRNQPVFNAGFDNLGKMKELQEFILNIFNQRYENAYRRGWDTTKYIKGVLVKQAENLRKLSI